jgi:hypothetical protein
MPELYEANPKTFPATGSLWPQQFFQTRHDDEFVNRVTG